ncbi:MAG: T9SS type A sorting domain-containing protein [Candidatus Cloacimonetes bacterium]|nr:T9SS type A sorting domain-containing protein [Candidatus Cloacimonadota bacterium]
MKTRILFILWGVILSISLSAEFPQEKVTELILDHHQSKSISNASAECSSPTSNAARNISTRDHVYSSEYDFIMSDSREILYIGPGADTTFIYSDYQQDGDIVVCGDGVLLVDGATLTLYGHLYQQDNGKVILQNGAYLHVPQLFNCQYLHALHDNATFEAIDSTVDGNVVYQIRQYDNSEYTALQTTFTHWNFRKLWDQSSLTLVDANMVGDLTINDSVEVEFTRCDTILPWFGASDDDVFDYQFPDWDIVPDYVFDDNLSGIDGVDYTVTFDDCIGVMWGIESWASSSVHVDSSFICIVFRIDEDVSISDIENYEMYDYLSFPFTDRTTQITNCYLHMWFPYVYFDAVVHVDDCRYAESKAHDQSEIYFTNTISDGFPSCTSPVDDGFILFEDGVCRTFSSSWFNATLLLINTRFEPRPNFDATQNIAHGNSTFLASNCTFPPENEPYARDAALVMFAAIDSLPNYEIGDNIEIAGSAWIDTGPNNQTTFDSYTVHYAPVSTTEWILIEESTEQVSHDVLAEWDTSDLEDGDYDLLLTIFDSAGDSLIALRAITLLESSGTGEDISSLKTELLGAYPNPFNPSTTLRFSLAEPGHSTLCVYNIRGRRVATLLDEPLPAGEHSVTWQAEGCASGVYLARLTTPEGVRTARLALLK